MAASMPLKLATIAVLLALCGCAAAPEPSPFPEPDFYHRADNRSVPPDARDLAYAQCRAEAVSAGARMGAIAGSEAYAQYNFGGQLSDIGDTLAANRNQARRQNQAQEITISVMDACMARAGYLRR